MILGQASFLWAYILWSVCTFASLRLRCDLSLNTQSGLKQLVPLMRLPAVSGSVGGLPQRVLMSHYFGLVRYWDGRIVSKTATAAAKWQLTMQTVFVWDTPIEQL